MTILPVMLPGFNMLLLFFLSQTGHSCFEGQEKGSFGRYSRIDSGRITSRTPHVTSLRKLRVRRSFITEQTMRGDLAA